MGDTMQEFALQLSAFFQQGGSMVSAISCHLHFQNVSMSLLQLSTHPQHTHANTHTHTARNQANCALKLMVPPHGTKWNQAEPSTEPSAIAI